MRDYRILPALACSCLCLGLRLGCGEWALLYALISGAWGIANWGSCIGNWGLWGLEWVEMLVMSEGISWVELGRLSRVCDVVKEWMCSVNCWILAL